MRIIIAPDKFKESLTAPQACEAIAGGLRSAWPDAELDLCPMADGGEGTVESLVAATGGRFCDTRVRGPLEGFVTARWGLLGGGAESAVIEMSAASGLALVPAERRNPLVTTTFGTGELIRAALDAGVRRVILGIGGSATNDGGVGCAQALGWTFLDDRGRPLPDGAGGGQLFRIARVDGSRVDPRLRRTEILVACDVTNPLCGPQGAAAVYGPQKGATPEMVQALDAGLVHLADVISRDLSVEVRDLPGAGAAGGLGAGLVAFAGGRLRRGIEIVMEAVRLRERLERADLVVTGEGRLDRQSAMGKVIAGVADAARTAGVPVLALVGSMGEGAEAARDLLDACFSIVDRPMSLTEALASARGLLERAAEQLGRVLRLRAG